MLQGFSQLSEMSMFFVKLLFFRKYFSYHGPLLCSVFAMNRNGGGENRWACV